MAELLVDDVKAEFQKAKERALRLLARRDHSAYELRNKLKQKIKISDEVWNKVHAFLKELGYMVAEDDLAGRWIKQWREEGRGRKWIAGKLKSKGLPAPAMNDTDEEIEAAKHFLEKKLAGGRSSTANLKARAKLNRALLSRGFSNYVASTVMRLKK